MSEKIEKVENWTKCAQHYDAISIDSRKSRRCDTQTFRLRAANNAVKSLQIEACVRRAALLLPVDRRSLVVHDFACGRGGDLAKYGAIAKRLGIFIDYYGVDVSSQSVAELDSRWQKKWERLYGKNMAVTATLGNMCTRESPAFYDCWPVADIVSIQFAIHYAWHSVGDSRALANNIGRSLATQTGQLICSIVDSERLLALLSQMGDAKDGSLQFKNQICEIDFPLSTMQKWLQTRSTKANTPAMYNANYRFSLLDCVDDFPEPVVLEKDLKSLFEGLGLKCCESLNFGHIETFESENLDIDERAIYCLYSALTFVRGLL